VYQTTDSVSDTKVENMPVKTRSQTRRMYETPVSSPRTSDIQPPQAPSRRRPVQPKNNVMTTAVRRLDFDQLDQHDTYENNNAETINTPPSSPINTSQDDEWYDVMGFLVNGEKGERLLNDFLDEIHSFTNESNEHQPNRVLVENLMNCAYYDVYDSLSTLLRNDLMMTFLHDDAYKPNITTPGHFVHEYARMIAAHVDAYIDIKFWQYGSKHKTRWFHSDQDLIESYVLDYMLEPVDEFLTDEFVKVLTNDNITQFCKNVIPRRKLAYKALHIYKSFNDDRFYRFYKALVPEFEGMIQPILNDTVTTFEI